MAFSLSRWRPRHLFLAWAAYWLVLALVTLGGVGRAALGALTAPQGHGTISAGMANGVMNILVKSDSMAYTGSASLLSIALWVAGPPLLLFALWAATRSSPAAARERIS